MSALPRITRAVADRRVLFFGDSLVAGVGDPAGLGWVGRIVGASYAAGMPLTAHNLGVRGETSVQVAARWPQETRARLLPSADTRLVVSFGANDTTVEAGQRRVEEPDSLRALEEILGRAAALALPVLVVGPAPVDDAKQNRRIQSLSVAFGAACAQRGVRFVGVFDALLASDAWCEQVSRGDGAHPGARGYQVLAELVLAGGWIEWLNGDHPGTAPSAPTLSSNPSQSANTRLATIWSIRSARDNDIDAVLALWALADTLPSVTDNAESLRRLLAFDGSAVLVADTGDEVVGSLILGWNGWRGSFYRLAVAPEHRRLGLATALVREGERRLRERGAVRLDAIVAADQATAMSFWRAAGYQHQNERSRFVRNV